MAKYTLI